MLLQVMYNLLYLYASDVRTPCSCLLPPQWLSDSCQSLAAPWEACASFLPWDVTVLFEMSLP